MSFHTDQEQFEALVNDQRYQRSIDTIFGKSSDEESTTLITTLDEQRLLIAKNQLIGDGVDAHTADSNLRKIADAILASTNSRIDACLSVASQLDQKGEWDESVEVYSQVIATLPDTDERVTYARNCLAAVNEKRNAIANEEGGESERR